MISFPCCELRCIFLVFRLTVCTSGKCCCSLWMSLLKNPRAMEWGKSVHVTEKGWQNFFCGFSFTVDANLKLCFSTKWLGWKGKGEKKDLKSTVRLTASSVVRLSSITRGRWWEHILRIRRGAEMLILAQALSASPKALLRSYPENCVYC